MIFLQCTHVYTITPWLEAFMCQKLGFRALARILAWAGFIFLKTLENAVSWPEKNYFEAVVTIQ